MDIHEVSEHQRLSETYGADFNVQNLIRHSMKFWNFAASAKLLWPDFIEHKELILLSDNFDQDGVDRWLSSTADRTAIEFVINEVTLWDLFDDDDPDSELLDSCLPVLHEAWYCKLERDFTDRKFIVSISTDSEYIYGPSISFATLRE